MKTMKLLTVIILQLFFQIVQIRNRIMKLLLVKT